MQKCSQLVLLSLLLCLTATAVGFATDDDKLVFEDWQNADLWKLHDGVGKITAGDGKATFVGDATGTNQAWTVFERNVTIDVDVWPILTLRVHSVSDHWFLYFLPGGHPSSVPLKLDSLAGTTTTGIIEIDLRTIRRDMAGAEWAWSKPRSGRFLLGVSGPQTNTMKYAELGEIAFWKDEG